MSSTLSLGMGVYKVLRWADREGWLDRVKTQFRTKHHVLVVGTSGAGKTAFLNSLADPLSRSIARDDRTKFSRSRRLSMPNQKEIFIFRDTPGEVLYAPRRAEAIRDVIGKSNFGIINVAAYGYLETDQFRTEQVLSADGSADPDYLARQRRLEINALSEWTHASGLEADYVVTLVSKADLWWPARGDVEKHYLTGPYGQAIKKAGIQNHTVLRYSSVIHRFYGEGQVSPEFDQDTLIDLRYRFQQQILQAVARP